MCSACAASGGWRRGSISFRLAGAFVFCGRSSAAPSHIKRSIREAALDKLLVISVDFVQLDCPHLEGYWFLTVDMFKLHWAKSLKCLAQSFNACCLPEDTTDSFCSQYIYHYSPHRMRACGAFHLKRQFCDFLIIIYRLLASLWLSLVGRTTHLTVLSRFDRSALPMVYLSRWKMRRSRGTSRKHSNRPCQCSNLWCLREKCLGRDSTKSL